MYPLPAPRREPRVATITGVLLRERKARLGPRKFKPWIEEHFEGSYDTAKRYVKLAEENVPIECMRAPDSAPETPLEDPEVVSDEDTEVIEGDEPSSAVYVEIVCSHCNGTGRVSVSDDHGGRRCGAVLAHW